MGTQPDISKGEGLIRTYDLLSQLILDVEINLTILSRENDSQTIRRNFIRSVFSFIEGTIQILKYEIRKEIHRSKINIVLTKKEEEILSEIKTRGTESISWNVPLDSNIKKTLSIASKVWSLKKEDLISSKQYQSLLEAKRTRNRLTHPRKYYDIEITPDEIELSKVVFEWLKSAFYTIIKHRIDLIKTNMNNSFVNRYAIAVLQEYIKS